MNLYLNDLSSYVIRMTFVQNTENRIRNIAIKLDPRTKLLMLLFMSLLSLMILNFYLLLGLFGIMIFLIFVARLQWKKFFRYIKPTLWLLPVIFIIQLLFPISTSGPSFELFTNFGFMSNNYKNLTLSINFDSIIYATNSCLRVINLAIGSCLFSLTTNTNEYLQSLTKMAIPYGIAFTTGLVIYFLPMVVNEANDTRDALETRGISINKGPFISRIKNLNLLFASILFNFIEKSKYQAIALDSRGFNPRKKRSYYRAIELKLIDISFIIFSVEFFSLMCYIFRLEILAFFSFVQY